MCLHELMLTTTYTKGEYIGTGYKVMGPLKGDGSLDLQAARSQGWSRQWRRAKGGWHDTSRESLGNYIEYADRLHGDKLDRECMADECAYPAGYHIFLKKEDAIAYGKEIDDKFRNLKLVKVEFKNILAFGTNETRRTELGLCVIAEFMRIVEEL